MENNTGSMKIRSIRTDDATIERFKAMAEAFPNQSEALASLLTAWETQSAKEALPGLATDISDFDSHLKSIQNAFLHVLDINQSTEERVRGEVQQLLSSKDNQIIELQERVRGLEQAVQTAQEQATAAETNASAISEENSRIIEGLKSKVDTAEKRAEEMSETAATAKALVDSLQGQLKVAQAKADSSLESEKRISEMKKDLDESQAEVSNLKKQIETEREAAAQAKELAAERAELAVQKAVVDEQRKAAEQAREQSEKASQQAKEHAEEAKALYAQISELKDQIQKLNLEKIQFQTQVFDSGKNTGVKRG